MKNENLLKQLKKLSKLIPKHIVIVPELRDRELTKDEFKVIEGYLNYYNHHEWKPVYGMVVKYFSRKSTIDFAFMATPDENSQCCIYLNLK